MGGYFKAAWWTPGKAFIAGIVVTILILIGVVFLLPSKDHKINEPVISTDPAEINHSDYVFVFKSQGELSGSVPITSTNGAQINDNLIGYNYPSGRVNFGSGQIQPQGTTFTGTGSVNGNVWTTITDKRTGKELWSGNSPLSGVASVVGQGNSVGLDVKFTNTQTFGIDLPSFPKLNHVGIYGSFDTNGNRLDTGGFYQRDFLLKDWRKTDLRAYGRSDIDVWPHKEGRFEGGILFSW